MPGPVEWRGPAATVAPHDLAAVVHVHSTYSDGAASVPEILEAAADAEADAVFLTDRDTLQARRDGHEGWHHGVLLLVGLEVSPEQGHFLAFGLDEEIAHEGRDGRAICDALERTGALRFPAHPWQSVEDLPVTGVELWGLVTDAIGALSSPRELASFISRPEQAVDHPPARNLAAWDRLCRRRRVVAIGGLDAHHDAVRFAGGPVLSPRRNARFFRMLRTHVLCARAPTGDLETDRGLILGALAEGRCYLGRDSLATTRGFRFYADMGDRFLPMGGEAPAGGWELHARLPLEAELLLLRDGREMLRTRARKLDAPAFEPGVYRLEARLRALGRSRTWILSNPIYLR